MSETAKEKADRLKEEAESKYTPLDPLTTRKGREMEIIRLLKKIAGETS